ncbi:MAG: hypothetical protein ACR2HQ_02320 [Ilumatobacteraceae bacterium]
MNTLWSRLGGVLGIAYCVAGFFLIFLGWNGAATYDRVPAQLPYVVSGGFGGLGLIVLGSALIIAQSRRGAGVVVTAPTASSAAAPAAVELGGAETVVAGPTSYHRPGCRVIEGQADLTTMTLSAASASGRTPCRVCTPTTL